jgi:hypothetical protein
MDRARLHTPLVGPTLPQNKLIAALTTLAAGTLKDFRKQKSVLQPCFDVLDHPEVAAAFSLGGREAAFSALFMSVPSQDKPLVTAMAAAVNRGLTLVADLLGNSSSGNSSSSSNGTSSSSNSGAGSNEYPRLLTQLPAVGCISSCCSILLAGLRQGSMRPGDERRSAVEIAVLARTSGWCCTTVVFLKNALVPVAYCSTIGQQYKKKSPDYRRPLEQHMLCGRVALLQLIHLQLLCLVLCSCRPAGNYCCWLPHH